MVEECTLCLVVAKAGVVSKLAPAWLALVWHLTLVGQYVCVVGGQLCVGQAAGHTREGLVCGDVQPLVVCERLILLEGQVTELALEGPLAGVNTPVRL